MTVKLHRCGNIWIKLDAHPCWRVQKALDDAGRRVRGRRRARGGRASATDLEQLSGQRKYPVIEFEDGSTYREESKEMASGSRRQAAREARRRRPGPGAEATLDVRGAIAQLGERLDRTQEVGGSSPPSSISRHCQIIPCAVLLCGDVRPLLGGSRCDSLEPGARLEPFEDLAGLGEEGCVAGQLAVLELCDGEPERDLEFAESLGGGFVALDGRARPIRRAAPESAAPAR